MDSIVEKINKEFEEFKRHNDEHIHKGIDCILVNSKNEDAIVFARDDDSMIMFAPYITKENGYPNGYLNVLEWDFNFDGYIFSNLEKGYDIGYMVDDMHYSIWESTNELYPDDIKYKDGLQIYLQYCVDNGITKNYLDEKLNLDTSDITKYFDGLKSFETMEYKGYVIEADDVNIDNPKENIINIYENKEGFEKGNLIESVSLNTINLKQNIRDYIDEFYVDKTVVKNEQAYFSFVLGYDLLKDMIKKYDTLECDVNYDFCNKIAEQFLNSNEYKDNTHSAYEMLKKWLESNKEKIEDNYKEHIGFSDTFDNLKIVDAGHRRDEKIALVEKVSKSWGKEYIIAFNYETKDDKLTWGYGYYYYDIDSAKKDYNKVISGGNLARTSERNDDR